MVVLFFWKTHSRSMHAYNWNTLLLASRKENKDVFFSAIPFMPRRMELSVWYAMRFQLALQNYGQINCKTTQVCSRVSFGLYFVTLQILGSQGATIHVVYVQIFCRWKVQNFLSFRYWHKIDATSIGLVPSNWNEFLTNEVKVKSKKIL